MRFALTLAALAACHSPGARGDDVAGDDDATIDAPPGSTIDAPYHPGGNDVFDPSIAKVAVEIDYETGQEPYTGPILGWGDTFDTTVANIDRLFASKKMLDLPTTTAGMENIGAIADEELTIPDIIAIAMAHRDHFDAPGVKTYYVVFVSGRYVDETNTVQNGVLGVSIGTTGIVVMFKDVIRSTNVVGFPNVVRYVEQSTLVHELGHSIGLVANGVAMVTNHKDASHGAHCNNDACVMFWQNDGSADAAAYAQQRLLTNNTILFDAHCLADVDALTGGP